MVGFIAHLFVAWLRTRLAADLCWGVPGHDAPGDFRKSQPPPQTAKMKFFRHFLWIIAALSSMFPAGFRINVVTGTGAFISRWLLFGAKFHFAYSLTSTIESLYSTVQISDQHIVPAVGESYGCLLGSYSMIDLETMSAVHFAARIKQTVRLFERVMQGYLPST